jgi:hypothetical protein
MVALRIEDFAGLIPRLSARLLPDNFATVARNSKLLSGEARGFRTPTVVKDFTALPYTVKKAYRIPYLDMYGDQQETWLTFGDENIDVVRSLVVNDSYDRYYWAGPSEVPQYNTKDRIIAGSDPYLLGVPNPLTAPTISPSSTDIYAVEETRAYVYTFVSAYGEESGPSPSVIGVGGSEGVWTISGLETTCVDFSSRNITTKKIYRTVPGNVSTAFFYVGTVAIGTTTFSDYYSADEVAINNLLETDDWAPPIDMEGMVAMPNGYLVGWSGRTLHFSEPYRPHAWPAKYDLTTEFDIVGLAVWGSALIIGTESQPYIGQGVIPASFTMQKMDAVEPCLSRRGMVSTTAGAYYPSINGLVMVNASGVNVITQDILTKEEWAAYNPGSIFAAQLGLQYIAFNSTSFGFVFTPTEQKAKLVELDAFDQVNAIYTDRYTGNVFLIRADRIWEWDPETEYRLFWQWKSKEFHLPKPINFGAAKIKFATQAAVFDTATNSDYYMSFNTARFALPPLNSLGMNGTLAGRRRQVTITGWTEAQNRGSLGGSSLYQLAPYLTQPSVTRFRAYAGGVLVYDVLLEDELIMRLPTGFKRDVWQFEILSNSNVYSLQIAETGKGLDKV